MNYAAELNCDFAYTVLAKYHFYNQKNLEKGFTYSDKAATSQNYKRMGLYFRGLYYYTGRGVNKDYNKAIEDWNKAKELGCVPAYYYLANAYNFEIIKDETGLKKIELLRLGMQKNHFNCIEMLRDHYFFGKFPLKRDSKKAEELENLAKQCREEYCHWQC